MGKDKERSVARLMYVEQGKTAVEIAFACKVQEKTVGEWVKREGWKEQRNAYLNGKAKRLENIQQVIDDLVEQRLEIGRQIKEATENGDKETLYLLNKMAVALSDEVSKYNKAKVELKKGEKVSLEQYLEMMQMHYDELRKYDEKLYNATLDFQELHVQYISKILG